MKMQGRLLCRSMVFAFFGAAGAAWAGPGELAEIFYADVQRAAAEKCAVVFVRGDDENLTPELRRRFADRVVVANDRAVSLIFERVDNDFGSRGEFQRRFQNLNGSDQLRTARFGSMDDFKMDTPRWGRVAWTSSARSSNGARTQHVMRRPSDRSQRSVTPIEFEEGLREWSELLADHWCKISER
jgi:hypothetical protein